MSEVNEKEKRMCVEKIYRSDKFQLYITIDRKKKVLMASDYILGEYYPTTCGCLSEVNSFLAEELRNYFNITLREYGVKTLVLEDIVYIDETNKKI